MSEAELVIGPYFHSPAVCHDYDPRAPAVARHIASMITSRLGTLTVEHIGSTSVPGCAGKGVIDLMVLYPPIAVPSSGSRKDIDSARLPRGKAYTPNPNESSGNVPGQLENAKQVLADLGFQRQTTRDPFPEDRPMRTGSVQYQGNTFRIHAHVLASDSSEVEELRTFRDRLRTDTHLVAAYVAQKQEIIASGITDSVEYAEAKGSFVQKALARRQDD